MSFSAQEAAKSLFTQIARDEVNDHHVEFVSEYWLLLGLGLVLTPLFMTLH